jgi:hypothetical protein
MEHPMKRLAILLPLAAIACTPGGGAPIGSQTKIESRYNLQDLSYVAAGKDLRTEVIGNPFGGEQAAFANAVTDHLQGVNPGPEIHFTTTPADTARPPYFLRLVFNGPAASNGTALCARAPEAPGSAGPGGEVRVIGAFCRGDQPLTYTAMRGSGIAGADDPAFRQMVRQTGTLLFPLRNPETIPNCIPPNC